MYLQSKLDFTVPKNPNSRSSTHFRVPIVLTDLNPVQTKTSATVQTKIYLNHPDNPESRPDQNFCNSPKFNTCYCVLAESELI